MKPGDSLSKIAEAELGDASRWPEIQALNGIVNANAINVGQTLMLPRSGGPLAPTVDYHSEQNQNSPTRPSRPPQNQPPIWGGWATTELEIDNRPVQREQFLQIKSHFHAENISRACIRQLQRYLNGQGADLRESGWIDMHTAQALYDEAPDSEGKVGRDFFEARGLFYFKVGETLTPPGFGALQDAHPDGLTLSFYAKYSDPDGGNSAEFVGRANDHASQYQSLGFVPGSGDLSAALGVAVPIRDVSEIPQFINQLVRSVRNRYREFCQSLYLGGLGFVAPQMPKWCFVKNVALFSHGMHYGMAINSDTNGYGKGLGDERRPGSAPSNIKGFVDSISDVLTDDVAVQLFACSTAQSDPGSDVGNEWVIPEWGDQGGHESFAAGLNNELQAAGKDSTVYGHNTVGHVTSLATGRIFGAEAEKALGPGQSMHPFEVAFPRDFVQSELRRLGSTFHDEATIRRRMWDFYRPILGEERGNMGGRVFTDLHKTTSLIRHRWIERYPG